MDYKEGVLFFSGSSPALSDTKVDVSFAAYVTSIISEDFTITTTPSFLDPLWATTGVSALLSTFLAKTTKATSLCTLVGSDRFLSVPLDAQGTLATPIVSSAFKLVVNGSDPYSVTVMEGILLADSQFKDPGRVFSAPERILRPDSIFALYGTSEI